MSAEGRVEPCGKARAKSSGQDERAEKDVDASHRHKQPEDCAESKWPPSPDRSGMEDTTSGGLEQLSHLTVKQLSLVPQSGV